MSDADDRNAALAVLRERMASDIALFNDILLLADEVGVPRLKLRMLALVCGLESPFCDNSLEKVDVLRHFGAISARSRILAFEPPLVTAVSGPPLMVSAQVAMTSGLLLAEHIALGAVAQVELLEGEVRNMGRNHALEIGPALCGRVIEEPFIRSLCSALDRLAVRVEGDGKKLSFTFHHP